MTVDQGTNHYWGWGDNSYGQIGMVGTVTNGGATNQVSQYTPAGPVQFCTRCQRCVQLGTSGILTAQCTGTLTLYFNGEIGQFENYSGSYTASVSGLVTNRLVPAYVPDLNSNGVSIGIAVGTVTNGGTYSYSASGWCTNNALGFLTDPDGRDPSNNLVDCSFSYLNKTNAVCPAAQCFSLVGKIQ
jgi:hypothetical protein